MESRVRGDLCLCFNVYGQAGLIRAKVRLVDPVLHTNDDCEIMASNGMPNLLYSVASQAWQKPTNPVISEPYGKEKANEYRQQ
jgi:hypothetical protein